MSAAVRNGGARSASSLISVTTRHECENAHAVVDHFLVLQ